MTYELIQDLMHYSQTHPGQTAILEVYWAGIISMLIDTYLTPGDFPNHQKKDLEKLTKEF